MNKKEPVIHSLFPTPIYTRNIDRKFDKKEINFVKEQKNHSIKNTGNLHTADNYILNRSELKKIKKFLEGCCQSYLEKIICPKNSIKLYITQSWLNYTDEKQYHHAHSHANSVVSGVLYFNVDKKNDSIKFYAPLTYRQISPETDENKYNFWNSDTWVFPVNTGQLLMFPSSTTHQVDEKKGSNTRISLSFNTFYEGTLGSNRFLTELKL